MAQCAPSADDFICVRYIPSARVRLCVYPGAKLSARVRMWVCGCVCVYPSTCVSCIQVGACRCKPVRVSICVSVRASASVPGHLCRYVHTRDCVPVYAFGFISRVTCVPIPPRVYIRGRVRACTQCECCASECVDPGVSVDGLCGCQSIHPRLIST